MKRSLHISIEIAAEMKVVDPLKTESFKKEKGAFQLLEMPPFILF
ncbi:hypothetical protein [Sphingobacterium sp.]|nr:hypothetical protein [Sphingobacterium sp.]